ncbi:MAG: hypothetical protein K2P89_10345, partial [Lachnospiraceae bacterium]|nr:hypothetical protein [Lachnospiraceae bacterium]
MAERRRNNSRTTGRNNTRNNTVPRSRNASRNTRADRKRLRRQRVSLNKVKSMKLAVMMLIIL